MQWKNVKYTKKLFAEVIAMSIFLIATISLMSIHDSKIGLYRLGEMAIESSLQSMYNSLILQNNLIKEKLSSDSKVFMRELDSLGKIVIAKDQEIIVTMTDQENVHATKTVKINPLYAGENALNGDEKLVDRVRETVGGYATLFQVVEGNLLRIATNVKKPDGSRAVGTYISSNSPVTQAILSGQAFEGRRANVVGEPYLATYIPLRDVQNVVIGAIFVGRPILSESVQTYITGTKLGKGYFFLYDDTENATVVLHPTLKGKSLTEIVKEFKGHKSGRLEYVFNHAAKVTYTAYIDEWKLHLGFGLNKDDIVNGLDISMLKKNMIVGVVGILFSSIMTIVLVRSIDRPLKKLAEKAERVGEGDYTITFFSEVEDSIGILTRSLGIMISKARNVLDEITQSAQALSASSTELSAISKQMEGGAGSTAHASEEVSQKTAHMAVNMQTVAAAMEESTTNLNLIAAATEEMGVTTQEIAVNGTNAHKITTEAVERARRSKDNVHQLGEVVRSIGKVADTITEISDQTNLLALNATIEAARAGEAGRGFAVVANEIKELARQTALATGEIKNQLNLVQARTGETVEDFTSVAAVISDVNDIVVTIATAVEEQSVTTSEIVRNVTEASRGINEINGKIADSSLMVQNVSSSVAEVRGRAQEVNENSIHVTSASVELSQMAERLTSLTSQFKI